MKITTKQIAQFLLTLVVSITLFSCSTPTKIIKSWHEPESKFDASAANKILIIALVKDETSRRIIEDQLVKRIGTNASSSYRMIPPDMLTDASEEKLSEKLKQDKYAYVLVMRLADVEKETSYVQGTTTAYYGGYGRYYHYGASMYSTPGYYTTDKNYFVETTAYSVNPDKLVWTGTTKTVNPTKLEKVVTEIADVVSDKMRSDGFLK